MKRHIKKEIVKYGAKQISLTQAVAMKNVTLLC